VKANIIVAKTVNYNRAHGRCWGYRRVHCELQISHHCKKIFESKGTEQFSLVGPVLLLAVVCILSPALKCGGLIS